MQFESNMETVTQNLGGFTFPILRRGLYNSPVQNFPILTNLWTIECDLKELEGDVGVLALVVLLTGA